MLTLTQARNLFGAALAAKLNYENYLRQNPGANGAQQPLSGLHQTALNAAAALSAGGYQTAANLIEADSYAALNAWYQANPDLGSSGTPYGTDPGTGGGGTTGGSTPPNTGSGIGNVASAAYSLMSGLLNDIQSIIGVLINPGAWFTGLGGGLQTLGTDVGAGASSAAGGASGGISQLWKVLVWPFVIVAGLVAVDRWSKKRRAR